MTTGATGVADPDLRLDDAQNRPTWRGLLGFEVHPSGTELATGNALVLEAGDFVFCSVGAGYGWHMVSTGATGASTPDLRLDQAVFQALNVDCAQLEPAPSASSYLDELQGPGHSGLPGFPTRREGGILFFEAGGVLQESEGTVAFWMRPGWAGDDSVEHVLFDAAESSVIIDALSRVGRTGCVSSTTTCAVAARVPSPSGGGLGPLLSARFQDPGMYRRPGGDSFHARFRQDG